VYFTSPNLSDESIRFIHVVIKTIYLIDLEYYFFPHQDQYIFFKLLLTVSTDIN
jgi:hypothetical protein